MTAIKTVVHLTTVHSVSDARVFHRECVSLAKAGYAVYLIGPSAEPSKNVEGVRIESLGKRRTRRGLKVASRLLMLVRAAWAARRIPADIYHLHDPELILLGKWLQWTTRAKVVFDSHEDYVAFMQQRYYLPPALRRFLASLMTVLEKSAARSFDAIVTADNGTADIYRKFGARNTCIVRNLPRLDLFPPSATSDAPDRGYDLVYHGSIPRYHLEEAFAVASNLKSRGRNVRWLFFGCCYDLAWAQAEMQRRGLTENFTIEGPIPHGQVSTKIRSAKIGFIPLPDLPKFHNNIPTKLFEFMALGMPVVLSDLPPSRPFVGDGRCAIMVPPGDHNAYADAIVRLLDNPQLCAMMGAEARKRVDRQYNWECESQQMLSLYKELVGS